MDQNAEQWVYERNAFYKHKYRFILSVYVLSWIAILILASILVYLIRHPTQPIYFAADRVSRLVQDVPLSQPNMPIEDVKKWAVEAVQSAYSYDFMNYRLQLQNAQKYFSPFGWQSYMSSLRVSNNLVAVNDRKMVVIAAAVSDPKLIVQGLLGKAYAWKFEIPMLVTYLLPPYNDQSRFQNPLVVTVVIQRQGILESYHGLGIVQLIGNLVFTPSQPIAPAST